METIQVPYHCPRWRELPELALYMDQVRIVIGQALAPLTGEDAPAVTATMINNYAKMKLIPPAEKKKYVRPHIARLLVICLLKRVLSLTEIAAVLETMDESGSPEAGYDAFCQALEAQLQDGPAADCPEILEAAIHSLVGKLRVEALMALRAEAAANQKEAAREKAKDKQPDEKKNKEKEKQSE